MSEDGWEFECIPCAGAGYKRKLSCGGTGYRMRTPCKSCSGKGTVNDDTHKIQAEDQRKYWAEKYKVI